MASEYSQGNLLTGVDVAGFSKVFSTMWGGSLYGRFEASAVFMVLLSLTNRDGIVDMTAEAIAGATGWPLDFIRKGIRELAEPDPRSRTPDEEGRRLVLIDDHRDWGWRITNYQKYRDEMRSQERREYLVAKKREQRERDRAAGKKEYKPSLPRQIGFVYYAIAGDRIKIGFSKNPWARVGEFKTTIPEVSLAACHKGTYDTEKEIHTKFADLRIDREWFRAEQVLIDHIVAVNKSTNVNHVQPIADADADADADLREEKPRATARPATHLPDDFELTTKREAVAIAEKLDPARTFANFCDYWRAASGAKARKRDWDATWRVWCRNDRGQNGTHQQVSRETSYEKSGRKLREWAEANGVDPAILP